MYPEPTSAKAPSATPFAPVNFRRSNAARYIREKYGMPCSVAWLAKLACLGGGPVYRLAGRFPVYAVEDLDVWALARLSAPRRSTSDVRDA
jgi:hypothetical protein